MAPQKKGDDFAQGESVVTHLDFIIVELDRLPQL